MEEVKNPDFDKLRKQVKFEKEDGCQTTAEQTPTKPKEKRSDRKIRHVKKEEELSPIRWSVMQVVIYN